MGFPGEAGPGLEEGYLAWLCIRFTVNRHTLPAPRPATAKP